MNGLAEFISLVGVIAGVGFLIYLFRGWLGEKKKQTPNPVPDLTEDEPTLPSSGGLIDDLLDDDNDLFNDPPISVPGDIGEGLLDPPPGDIKSNFTNADDDDGFLDLTREADAGPTPPNPVEELEQLVEDRDTSTHSASPVEDISPGVYEEIGDGAGRGEDKLDDYPSPGSDSADSFCGSGNEDEYCGGGGGGSSSDDSSSRDEDPPTDV